MKRIKAILKALSFILLGFFSHLTPSIAQDSCDFKIRLFDAQGNGWNGSQLFIRLGNNTAKAFTLDSTPSSPLFRTKYVDLRVRTGDSIFVRYEAKGGFQNEIQYSIINNAQETIFEQGPTPSVGEVFKNVVRCIRCDAPNDLVTAGVRAFTTTVAWNPSIIGDRATYRVQWHTSDFVPGAQIGSTGSTTDTFAVLPSLKEVTQYYMYVRTGCSFERDTSRWVGPLVFRTDTASNVGVVDIIAPINRCDLGNEAVKIKVKNFAGAPTSLFEYKYSVNGQNQPVSVPSDGLYTGVITKDSIITLQFKSAFNFSQPGEYNIAAWTELKGDGGSIVDQNRSNDTFRYTFTRPRLISQFPYQQDFEGGKDTWARIDSSFGKNSTWVWDTPQYGFTPGAASGIRAWTTGGNGGYKNRDTSYLLSPCFDFTALSADPRISFALSVHTEARVDGAWLELSENGGQTWRKIGSQNDGVNWYNDTKINTNFAFWAGTNRVNWEIAQNLLAGAARKDRVRVRFAFTSDAKNDALFDGIAVDNIVISEVPASDLAIDNIKRTDNSDCGLERDSLSVRIFNLGSAAQNTFTVSYRLDNNAVVIDTINNVSIAPNQSVIYKFKAPVNTALPFGNHNFRVWVNQISDNIRLNDTARASFFIAPPTGGNLAFNFDNGLPPQYWIASRAKFEVGEHGNRPTNGYATANIFNDTIIVGRDTILTPNAQTFDLTTNKFGAVRTTDSLSYAFRFVNPNVPYAGYDLTNQDTFRVMASENCGRTWTMLDTIFRSRHTPTDTFRSRKISLRPFEGKFIKIRFFVTSAINSSAGYFFDLDNVSFQSACPATFNAQATVKNVQGTSANGEITLANPTAGLAPFTYAWSNGATTQNLRNLASGVYTVTITDGNNCKEVRPITVNQVTPTEELNSPIEKWLLAPNPTTDAAILTLELRKTTDVKVQIINLLGQVVSEQVREKIKDAQFDIDLSRQPAGIYLVRILADNKAKTIRIAKQ